MSLLSLLRFLRVSHFKCSKNASHAPSYKDVVSCFKPRRSILNFFELILKTYTRGVPNRTAIFQDWAHQSFICCLFYRLWTCMGPSQGFRGTGEQRFLFKEKKETKDLQTRETWEQRKFWGKGDIENEDFDFGEQGNKAIYFRVTREQVSG